MSVNRPIRAVVGLVAQDKLSREDVDFLSTVIETQRDIAAVELNSDTVMEMILHRTRSLMHADGAAIDLLEGENLVCHAQLGVAAPVGYRFPLSLTLSGHCIRTGEVGYCRDGLTDPRVDRTACERFNTRSFAIVPLHHAGQDVGVLKVISTRVDAFTERDIAALQLMAGLLSGAIGNAHEFAVKRRLLSEHSRMLSALRQSEAELRRFYEIESDRTQVLEMVAEGKPLEDVLARVARMIDRQVAGGAAAAFFLEDGKIKVAGPALPRELLAQLQAQSMTLAAGLCAAPVGASPALRSEVLAESQLFERCRSAAGRFACCWSKPVRSSEAIFLGMLTVFVPERREPTAAEARAVDLALKSARIAIEHRQIAQMLQYRIRHDVLTGLPNRILLEDRLQQSMTMARQKGRHVGLMVLDLDHFKDVNDTYGHHAGDVLLQQFSQRVVGALREIDTLARIGGDEFLAVLPDLGGPEEVDAAAQAILDALARPFSLAGQEVAVTVSLGTAVYPEAGHTGAALQSSADAAMYLAKRDGRNCFRSRTRETTPTPRPGSALPPPASAA